MICTTIQNKDYSQIIKCIEGCEMAEIRLDRCRLSMEEISMCFNEGIPLIATCRVSEIMAADSSLTENGAAAICEKRLIAAIEAGAHYVDVEIEAPKQMAKRIMRAARDNGTVFIRSYHDFNGTASFDELKAMVERCLYHGAETVKIVTTATSTGDCEKVLALYGCCGNGGFSVNGESRNIAANNLIAFCMGEIGHTSRIECLKLGAPYTYAALSADESAAPGQLPASEMARAIYGNRKFIDTVSSKALRLPASKSFAQRAIIAATLAEGISHLSGYTPCDDSEAAIAVASALGAKVMRQSGNGRENLEIHGIGASAGMLDITELNVGESGLLTRMMIPLVAQISSCDTTVTGRGTLVGRKLTDAGAIMSAFDVDLSGEMVPLTVSGNLGNRNTEVSGAGGSQLISGLLMALPLCEKFSLLSVKEPKSIPYLFMTLDVLKHFGIKVSNEMSGGQDFLDAEGDWSLCTGIEFKIRGGQKYHAADFSLEGDWSAAANFLVAGAVFGQIELDGLDTTSIQADISIMDILSDAGASLSQIDGETGIIAAQKAPLSAFDANLSQCPDLFPIVSVLATFCEGTSRIEGVGRLANKESDRASAIVEMLTQMGVSAKIEKDFLVIEGHSLARRCLCGNLLRGGNYSSHHDHRMVMALKTASLGASSPILIDDETCVAKSFPGFLEMWDKVIVKSSIQRPH